MYPSLVSYETHTHIELRMKFGVRMQGQLCIQHQWNIFRVKGHTQGGGVVSVVHTLPYALVLVSPIYCFFVWVRTGKLRVMERGHETLQAGLRTATARPGRFICQGQNKMFYKMYVWSPGLYVHLTLCYPPLLLTPSSCSDPPSSEHHPPCLFPVVVLMTLIKPILFATRSQVCHKLLRPAQNYSLSNFKWKWKCHPTFPSPQRTMPAPLLQLLRIMFDPLIFSLKAGDRNFHFHIWTHVGSG